MHRINLLNPIRNSFHHLATTAPLTGTGVYVSWPASLFNPTAPTAPTRLTVSGGTANDRDSTTGSTVDFSGWSKIQGGADFLANGPGSSMSHSLFAVWGDFIRPIVETTGRLHSIGSGETVAIIAMLGDPSAMINFPGETRTNDEVWAVSQGKLHAQGALVRITLKSFSEITQPIKKAPSP